MLQLKLDCIFYHSLPCCDCGSYHVHVQREQKKMWKLGYASCFKSTLFSVGPMMFFLHWGLLLHSTPPAPHSECPRNLQKQWTSMFAFTKFVFWHYIHVASTNMDMPLTTCDCQGHLHLFISSWQWNHISHKISNAARDGRDLSHKNVIKKIHFKGPKGFNKLGRKHACRIK